MRLLYLATLIALCVMRPLDGISLLRSDVVPRHVWSYKSTVAARESQGLHTVLMQGDNGGLPSGARQPAPVLRGVASQLILGPLELDAPTEPSVSEIEAGWRSLKEEFAHRKPSGPRGIDSLVQRTLEGSEHSVTLNSGRIIDQCALSLSPCNTDEYMNWAPIAALPKGEQLASRLLSLSESGRPIVCAGASCLVLVNVTPEASVKRIVVCVVGLVGDQLGVPHNCESVYVVKGPDRWVRVVDRLPFYGCRAAATLTLTGGFALDFAVHTSLPLKTFADVIQTALSNPPTSLQIATRVLEQPGRMLAISTRRPSPVLQGLREILEVRAEVSEREERGLGRILKIALEGHLLLSKQNVGDTRQFRGSSEAERSIYLEVLAQTVTSVINRRCTSRRWVDKYTVYCGEE
jgi:hypothetical protein